MRKRIPLALIAVVCIVTIWMLTGHRIPPWVPLAGTGIELPEQAPAAIVHTQEEKKDFLTLAKLRAHSFSDVEQTASYRDCACYVTGTGLMSDASPGCFAPTAEVTGADLIHTLYQMSDARQEETASPAQELEWAASEGLMNGISETIRIPDRVLTREQTAALLYAYAGYAGYETTCASCIQEKSDADQVHEPCRDAVDWALSSGIFKPLVAARILPDQPVTRAQLAKVLVCYVAQTTGEPVAAGIADALTPALSCSANGESTRQQTIQTEIDRIAQNYGAVGVQVAVIRDGAVTETYAYGSATKNVQPMTADTKLRVASISKVVLGMVTMALQEDGVVDIDGDISDYWDMTIRNPWYKDTPVTLRSILSHTSSITVYGDGVSTTGSAIRSKLASACCFSHLKPGDIHSWGYNNYAFCMLGITLELAADETVNSIADRKFFDRLDIDASYGSGNVESSMLATLYNHDGSISRSVDYQKTITGSTTPGQTGSSFAGGLTISSYDLAKLIAVLANDGVYDDQRLLTADSVAMMETVSEEKIPDKPFYQGLPLCYQTGIYGQNALYYHTGSAYGVYHCASYNPETKDGVVVLTTGASGAKDDHNIYKICAEISDYIYRSTGNAA